MGNQFMSAVIRPTPLWALILANAAAEFYIAFDNMPSINLTTCVHYFRNVYPFEWLKQDELPLNQTVLTLMYDMMSKICFMHSFLTI
jgi:hypothetical protein